MKVCFVSGSYPPIPCGIGDYLERLTAALNKAGVVAEIITSTSGGLARTSATTVIPMVSSWDVRALPMVLSKIRDLGPDIVNIEYPTQRYGRQPVVNLLPWLIRVRLGHPVVTTVHEFSTYHRLGRWRVGLSVFTSNAVIIPDRVNLNQMIRAFPRFQPKMFHVPLGANIEPRLDGGDPRQRRAQYGADDSSIVLVYFGFVSPSKGIEILLEAFRCLEDKHPEGDIHLVMIANREAAEPRYMEYHRSIERSLQALGGEQRMHWTGYLTQTEVSAYLASADIAVLPFLDGASLRRTTLISALAHGLPVISTQGNAIADERLNDEHGVTLVRAGDAGALAEAIWSLSQDSGRRKILAARAREFASGFSWPRIAAQTLEVYKKVLGEA